MTDPLTDEERKNLVAWLRESAPDWTVSGFRVQLAADEIERLGNELEESRQKELKFRIKEPEPWVIHDD